MGRGVLSPRVQPLPDGRRLAGINRTRVQVRDVADGREILILRGAHARSSDGGFNPVVAWSPDGSRLSASNWTGSISIWDARTETVAPGRRWEAAQGRIFGWHLAEADAAVAAGQPGPAAFHLDRLLQAQPPDATSLLRRAEIGVKLRRFDEADGDYARWFASGTTEDRVAHLAYARLFLVRGDREGYRDFFGRLLDSRERTLDAGTAWQVGRIAGLVPCSVAEAEHVVRLIRSFPTDAPTPAGIKFALSLAQYRAGQREPARIALQDFFPALTAMRGSAYLSWR